MTNLNAVTTIPTDIRNELESSLGIVPSFMRALPPNETRLWWAGMRDFEMSDKTALSNKTKELIGLGVASQIPCHYCVLFHTEAARLNGATEQELQESIFMASLTRQGSTILNGTALDQETFNAELKQIVSYLQRQSATGATKQPPAVLKR